MPARVNRTRAGQPTGAVMSIGGGRCGRSPQQLERLGMKAGAESRGTLPAVAISIAAVNGSWPFVDILAQCSLPGSRM